MTFKGYINKLKFQNGMNILEDNFDTFQEIKKTLLKYFNIRLYTIGSCASSPYEDSLVIAESSKGIYIKIHLNKSNNKINLCIYIMELYEKSYNE